MEQKEQGWGMAKVALSDKQFTHVITSLGDRDKEIRVSIQTTGEADSQPSILETIMEKLVFRAYQPIEGSSVFYMPPSIKIFEYNYNGELTDEKITEYCTKLNQMLHVENIISDEEILEELEALKERDMWYYDGKYGDTPEFKAFMERPELVRENLRNLFFTGSENVSISKPESVTDEQFNKIVSVLKEIYAERETTV